MIHGTLILVSDACRARLFGEHGLTGGLEELEAFTCPDSREHVKDRVTDRSGLKAGGGVTPRQDPKENAAQGFARHLAEILRRRCQGRGFDDLVLVAPPHFLGMLRGAMDETLARRVVATFDKDFTMLDAGELSRRIHAGVR